MLYVSYCKHGPKCRKHAIKLKVIETYFTRFHSDVIKVSNVRYLCNDKVMITHGVSASTNTEERYRVPHFTCSRVKKLLIYVAFATLFVAVALAIAIVYTGKDNFQSGDKRQAYEASKVATKKYPFIAAVFSARPYLFLCTALILNERYLLTSANCFTVLFPNIMVRTESTMWTKGGMEYTVEKFAIHEEYDSTSFENNIAVIKLKTDIIFDNLKVEVAAIRESEKPLEGEATVVGWGK